MSKPFVLLDAHIAFEGEFFEFVVDHSLREDWQRKSVLGLLVNDKSDFSFDLP